MAKKLALDQLSRQCATVDFDKGPFATVALIVDRASDEFLACAALSIDQHRRISRRHFAHSGENRVHLLGLADDLAEVVAAVNFFAQIAILFTEPLACAAGRPKFKHLLDL